MKYFNGLMEEAADGTESNGMGGDVTVPHWYYSAPNEESAGVPGQGETPPEWFKVDKFKSVDEQAKSYGELEKRFGGFVSAPEAYELPEGIEADALDEGMVNIVKEIGLENQMSQAMFNNLVGKVHEYQSGQAEAQLAQAKETLGEKADERISNVQNWLNTNAPKEIVDMVVPMANSAEAIRALEFFIDKSKGATMAQTNAQPAAKMSQSEYADALMATDSHGNLKISVDPEYKKKIDQMTLDMQR